MAIHPSFSGRGKEQPHRPRPLSRRNVEGFLYERDPEVEKQIRAVLSLDPASLIKRATIKDRKSPDFLKEESIVCLIREYLIRKDQATVGALFHILLRRCAKHIEHNLLSLDPVLAEEAFRDVVGDVVDSIVDLSHDRGDYLQVKFWSAITRRTIDVYRKYLVEQGFRSKKTTLDENGDAPETIDKIPAPCISEDDRCLCQEALCNLPDPIRTAFILRHYYGWQVESDDSEEPTISGYFNKTPRMIRNWFIQAEEILSRFREDKERGQ